MKLLPLNKLGTHEVSADQINFGFILPWVSPDDGNRLFVKVIKAEDQFIQDIQPHKIELTHSIIDEYGDYWSGTIQIKTNERKTENSQWGEKGKYLYRYELLSPLLAEPLDWIVDPFAREFGIGSLSAFTLGYEGHTWGDIEQVWKTPKLQDLIAYEIMLHEFASDIKGATQHLEYLKDLGINCIEIMPVSNVYRSVDWGFEPIGNFGVDERFGNRKDFQAFIQKAHENGIAVVLDMIYGHTGAHFAYEYVYNKLNYNENPFMGPFAKDMFGPSTDYSRQFTRDFFFTVNHFWLDTFHVDGIRYDCVPNYYDGNTGIGYANLVYNTYRTIKAYNGSDHWQRFFSNGDINLIQCAEQLEAPIEIVEKTYSNCTWQNETLNAAKQVAANDYGKLYDLAMQYGLLGYPEQITHNTDTMSKSAFQYLENHDHPRFICRFGTNSLYKDVFKEGSHENWYKLQPFTIGLLLAKGIPMLWEGQEIVENYDVPESGMARIGIIRPVRWEKFYTYEGTSMIALFRKLIALRNKEDVFRAGTYFFVNDWSNHQSRGVLIFKRELGGTIAIVALNFSNHDHYVNIEIEKSGNYIEQLHGEDNIGTAEHNKTIYMKIPGNYGKVWIKK